MYCGTAALFFAGSLCTSSVLLPTVTGVIALYNFSSALNLVELNRFQDMDKRQAILLELLRRHMLRCEALTPYIRSDSLFLEFTRLEFEDQGLVGAMWRGAKPLWLCRFDLTAYWKDVRLFGEGEVSAQGVFLSLQDYRYTAIEAHIRAPKPVTVQVLEPNLIDVYSCAEGKFTVS